MKRVAVIGVGCSKFGNRSDVTISELAFEAFKPAIEDAGITPKDVEFVALSSAGAGAWYEENLPAVVVSEYCGLTGAGLLRSEAACASGSAAFATAYWTVASGQADIALAIGVEKMRQIDTPTMVEFIGRSGYYLWEFHLFGLTFPGYYALHATAHMAKYGTTEEDLALVAVKNHKYASMNPIAHLRNKVTVEEALSSPVIAAPLKLYDCCPISDGAAAVILASEDKVKELKVEDPVWVSAVGYACGTANLSKRRDYVGLDSTVKAAQMAYRLANITPDQLDVALVHDCFTIAEIMAYEDLGFCKKGEGAKLIREGQTEIGGKIPVNVDGGLKAKGHPIGATGCAMIYELTKQLRGEAVERSRQVPMKNYIGLAHNVGGTGHYCYVTILRR
ncbi:MAG: thiolase domain-containing protein [Candidatus Nezhaarchaeota archaeon]|nr:thiolase domain-containing protein [Candidatus Nezhaarchaeota archaeon]MCX8142264.1 thiolase domain-containing protein [Candidatus Nezhaarchaeota archaeon]MDW8050763.1 thiolase domain-containing protein [Nitrososphaerota archaeon]